MSGHLVDTATRTVDRPADVAPSVARILVVDDDDAKRLAIASVLSSLGHQVVEADSGRAALRRMMAQDFAVILLDVRMPGLDGFETAELIRQRAQSESTPIIFCTSSAPDDIPEASRYSGGAVDFLFAPFSPDELRAKASAFADQFVRLEELARRNRDVQSTADHLQFVTDATPIGIYEVDAQRRFVFTNRRFGEIMGVPPDQVLGREWKDIFDLERLTVAASTLVDGAPAADELGQRFRLRTPEGPEHVLHVTSKPIGDAAGITGWIGTVADISADAWVEAALAEARDRATEASKLKSDFLANMSHEIRTPMNGVIGMTGLLLETGLDDVQRDYAQTVRNSGEALMAIINDILDFSKVEAGMMEVEEIGFDVQTIIDDVVGLLASSARGKGLQLVATVERSVPPTVTGDPGRVRQVLTNLIGNAIKFSDAGEVMIRASATGDPTGATVVRFEVSDRGDGIADDKLALIFQPFVQGDTSTSRKYGGTGLGLAICGSLVALMGGECGVTSRLGVGSTFWFTISTPEAIDATPGVTDGTESADRRPPPAVTREARSLDTARHEALTDPDLPTRSQDGDGARLLLAEDNLINQKVAVAMLVSAGYRVDTVADGAAAVRAAAAYYYDAILMDCQMPELNGYQATTEIRALEGPGRHTPIIAMTAGARREDHDRCLAEGMDGYLSKPVSKEYLLAVVSRTLREGLSSTEWVSLADESGREQVLDPVVLRDLRILGEASGGNFLDEVIREFIEDTEPLLDQLGLLLDGAEVDAVAVLAHIIKGSAVQLGGRRLAASCDHLASAASMDCLTGGPIALQSMLFDYQELHDALTRVSSLDRRRRADQHG